MNVMERGRRFARMHASGFEEENQELSIVNKNGAAWKDHP